LRDWGSMLDFLLKDHSTAAEGSPSAPGSSKKKAVKGKGKSQVQDDEAEEEDAEEDEDDEEVATLPEKLKLTEEEEALMIEVLVACLTRVIEVSRASTTQKVRIPPLPLLFYLADQSLRRLRIKTRRISPPSLALLSKLFQSSSPSTKPSPAEWSTSSLFLDSSTSISTSTCAKSQYVLFLFLLLAVSPEIDQSSSSGL
jgi:hypothetical protein